MAGSEDEASQTVYDFVSTGSYPTDTSLVSAPLTSSTLHSLEELLCKARTDVQASIRELSALSAPDIDGWVTQAKQIRLDRDASVAESGAIKKLHDEHLDHRAKMEDVAAQTALLEEETGFSAGLMKALQAVKATKEIVGDGDKLLREGKLVEAVQAMRKARTMLNSERIGVLTGTTAVDLLSQRIDEQREVVIGEIGTQWKQSMSVESENSAVTVTFRASQAELSDTVAALRGLELLDSRLFEFSQQITDLIIHPRLNPSTGSKTTVSVKDSALSFFQSQTSDASVKRLFADILNLGKFLKACFPDAASVPLLQRIMPPTQNTLLRDVLPKAVPPSLDGLSHFKDTLLQVSDFVKELNALGWDDTGRLSDWVESAPRVWLQARSADSLNSLRQVLRRGPGNPRSVERVETQTVLEGDEILADDAADGWNAEWGEDADEQMEPPQTVEGQSTAPTGAEEEEDANGWGWGEDEEEKPVEEVKANEGEDDDGADAWGSWENEDDEVQSPIKERKKIPAQQAPTATANGKSKTVAPAEKTITLRESYYITSLPEQIMELLIMLVEDADALSRSADDSNPVAQAAPMLYTLPAALLAMFRAAAPMAYGMHESGNMYLYNDSQYLSEQLRSFAGHRASRTAGHDGLVLQPDISALEIFGKRAYSREMEAQRTILGDLLDGAEGFENCTDEIRAGQCDLAVMSVIDRLRQVHAQWRDVLSPSAVLQATGSLLSTVVSKIIVDVEDLGDIGEAESQRLTGYCTSIGSLEDIFMPEAPPETEGGGGPQEMRVPSTAVYVPSWLKFQYLSNILESNLVDIRYLWTEGGLALEYSPDEVVDLIEALFADSPRRRECIADIRKR